jgi:4-diphosphocytidyl-2-C-methyl-D-erythritol kinase
MLIRRNGSPQGANGALFPSAVHVTAPAKINLYLEVLGKRPDGYHAIETVMLAVELIDELTLDADPSGHVSLTCDQPELSTGPDNLVLKAAHLLQQRTGCRRGASIRLTKRIPWAAGLGGGSSDAASALAGLNELWELGLSTDQLVLLGAELGSDVPFFFHPPAALCTGRGEVVKRAPVGMAFDIVLVKPPMGLSTAEVYRELGSHALRGNQNLVPTQSVGTQSVLEGLAEGNVEKLGQSLHNRLQAPAVKLCPIVAELLQRLRAAGVAGSLMSGSGSALFALCRDKREAERVAADLLSGLPSDAELARTRVFVTRSYS